MGQWESHVLKVLFIDLAAKSTIYCLIQLPEPRNPLYYLFKPTINNLFASLFLRTRMVGLMMNVKIIHNILRIPL